MTALDKIPSMKFCCINTNDYEYEPDIEYDSDGEQQCFTYEEFVSIISLCKRVGIPCKNLTDELQVFQEELKTFNNMFPPEYIPPAM